jgi:hypothetical protein
MGRRFRGAALCLDRDGTLNLRRVDPIGILPKVPAVRLLRARLSLWWLAIHQPSPEVDVGSGSNSRRDDCNACAQWRKL